MHGTSAFHLPSLAAPAGHVSVGLVNLLGVRVSARAIIDQTEHSRRRSVGVSAVTDPALLGRLLEMPAGQQVLDPVTWAETAGLPPGVVARGDDGYTVTRLLEPALVVHDVIVPGRRGREMLAVQQASLFAGFASRWVRIEAGPRDAVVMEAKLCGVGVVDQDDRVILLAERPDSPAPDGWAWLQWEKAYRRWLMERSLDRERESQAQATGAASVRPTG